ncbi:protein kinase domain-containing protein [Cellvibrio fibrivorans]|uniref:Serine/threonine-protein kinase n=1 Tax=Cellvibrio fibrivorans TaxID=126350 RepID=A0ABU1UT70_9GAMM|nr:protein kinase [Cellvibrio fibrivorans]MDR7088379.1 serine/threonine-protein kinase [Cellvibrio fibrivorans]
MNNSLPPNTVAAQTEPNKLGHYELLDCIGRGGMGLVYRARDTRLDRQVAIKCLRTELFEHHYVERFKREALLLAKLNHPNIVQIYDFIEAPDQLALVMELVEGQNLQLYLREHIAPFAQRMRWLTDIAQGLAVAHDAGIIHRDLKAENILINQRKVAKITDLGIAKSQDYNATLTDHVAGSYCSMSPEQAMGETIDFKSDLFSFGILAYQLLCGAHPFGDTNNKLQLMQRIISHPPTSPGKHNPNLPAEINDLLGQLLSKDPTKRPDNTHWVAAQFEALSHLQLANDFVSDDTQALMPTGAAANQSTIKNTGINNAVRTQDHPTFETRFVAVNATLKKSRWMSIKNYVADNKISAGFGLFSILLLAVVAAWQLQPKPPKYIAVIPPNLTANGMQESQQELVKGAVYDAIQQSVIQLDGFYLIPRTEISAVGSDLETVRISTAADELITANLDCQVELCTITLNRMTSTTDNAQGRLNVAGTKTLDVLTDNYLSVAAIVERNIESLYAKKSMQSFSNSTQDDYLSFLNINTEYRKSGANEAQISQLERLKIATKKLAATQTLFREITLDLYHQTKNTDYLDRLETFLSINNKHDDISHLYNLYFLKIAQHNNKEADLLEKKLALGEAATTELKAYRKMLNKDYQAAVELYKRSIESRANVKTVFYLANAYWYMGDTANAKKYLEDVLKVSPSFHEANSLYAIIALTEGRALDAQKSLELITQNNPDDLYNVGNLAVAYMLNGKHQRAADIFQQLLARDSENTSHMLNYADAQKLANNHTEAATIYQKIIAITTAIKPNNEQLRAQTQAYAQIGNFPAALTALSELEKIDSQNIETSYTAALVHSLVGNKASALLNIEKSLALGMHTIWFSFNWFDGMCVHQEFGELLKRYGEQQRCSLVTMADEDISLDLATHR